MILCFSQCGTVISAIAIQRMTSDSHSLNTSKLSSPLYFSGIGSFMGLTALSGSLLSLSQITSLIHSRLLSITCLSLFLAYKRFAIGSSGLILWGTLDYLPTYSIIDCALRLMFTLVISGTILLSLSLSDPSLSLSLPLSPSSPPSGDPPRGPFSGPPPAPPGGPFVGSFELSSYSCLLFLSAGQWVCPCSYRSILALGGYGSCGFLNLFSPSFGLSLSNPASLS